MKIRGRVWCLGDNIDTGVIISSKYSMITDPQQLAPHVFEALDPGFASKVHDGDIIVAGRNFGCGSSRETAPKALKAVGIKAIVAPSFGRIFYRNAVNIGLPVLECQEDLGVSNGDVIEANLRAGIITVVSTGKEFKGSVMPDFILDIVEAGGLLPLKRKQYMGEPAPLVDHE